MVNERQYIFLRFNLIVDMLITVIALVAAYYFRSSLAFITVQYADILPVWTPEIIPYEESHLLKEYLWFFPLCAMLWPLALGHYGYYEYYDLNQPSSRNWMIIKASIFSISILILFIFIFKLQFIARLVIAGIGVFTVLLLLLKEFFARKIFIKIHKKRAHIHNVIVVGSKDAFGKAEEMIESYKPWGLTISEKLDIESISAENLAKSIIAGQVEQVVFALAPENFDNFPKLAKTCEELGVNTKLLLDFYQPEIGKIDLENINHTPVWALNPTTQNFGALTIKFFGDKIISLILLILFLPLLVLIGIIIKISSKGPIVIKQHRSGINGKNFTLYKFRSMVNNAENLKENLSDENQMEGWAFKMKNDPRVTPVGRFLRRYSLDELLQLWNVLKGDMSLVGPRPALPAEVDKFQRWERRRLSMKPGMTGLWQVSGRNRIPNQEWISYDLKYIDNWNLKLDLSVLFKTISTVMRGEGL